MAKPKSLNGALRTVRKFFPKVTKVEDATEQLEIEVAEKDVMASAKKNHTECAMAIACKRAKHADGVIISINTAYIIKGDEAVRYKVPESVGREVIFHRDLHPQRPFNNTASRHSQGTGQWQ